MNQAWSRLVQRRIANTSVSPLAAHNMGPAGTVQAARNYLMLLRLNRFAVDSRKDFQTILDLRTTYMLNHVLLDDVKHWGAARKFLNIFLRGGVYNKYLCRANRLRRIERWLEVPVDSHVSKGLRRDVSGFHLEKVTPHLPRWRGVINITRQENEIYQEVASKIAAKHRVMRVHLDLKYWRQI